jgi:hypothetical protein
VQLNRSAKGTALASRPFAVAGMLFAWPSIVLQLAVHHRDSLSRTQALVAA